MYDQEAGGSTKVVIAVAMVIAVTAAGMVLVGLTNID